MLVKDGEETPFIRSRKTRHFFWIYFGLFRFGKTGQALGRRWQAQRRAEDGVP
jgi:hypothetical protein